VSNKVNISDALIYLENRKKEICAELRGLSHVPVFGWANPLNLLLRRRESYLLGELRSLILAIDLLSGDLR
jgi:hypothetical protein